MFLLVSKFKMIGMLLNVVHRQVQKKLAKTYNKGRFPNHSALSKYCKTQQHNIEDIEGKVDWLIGTRQDEMPWQYSDD